jgi:halocyanin-like protein
MNRDTLDRRTMLKTMAVGATSMALAGCSTGGGDADGSENSDDGGSGDDTTDGGSGEDDSGGGESMEFDGWFDDVSNYDGVVDETGSSEVTVEVGADGNNGAFAFAPAAITVSEGTTVVWEWTGEGGSHNVAAEDADFESETVGEAGHTFEHTFDSAGTYKYACTPHRAMGMKGAIVVE